MSDDILHTGPATAPAEGVQPSTEAPQGVADGTGVSAPTEVAPQEADERKQRQERARRNQEAAFRRLASERDEFKSLAMELARKGHVPVAQPQVQGDGAPQREKFASWEEYEDARIDWRAEQKVKQHQERAAQELRTFLEQSQREQHTQTLASQHAQRNADFASRTPDFEEVTSRDDVVIPDYAAEAIMSVPNGPAVLYAIGKEPALAGQMQQMTQAQQAAFVGQISAALMHRPPQVSKAPSPGIPVGGRGAAETQPTTASQYFDQITKGWRGKR